MGFNAPIPEELRNGLPENLQAAEDVADLMMTEHDRDWWKQNGRGIGVKFDLSDGSKSIRILRTYLFEKFRVNL